MVEEELDLGLKHIDFLLLQFDHLMLVIDADEWASFYNRSDNVKLMSNTLLRQICKSIQKILEVNFVFIVNRFAEILGFWDWCGSVLFYFGFGVNGFCITIIPSKVHVKFCHQGLDSVVSLIFLQQSQLLRILFKFPVWLVRDLSKLVKSIVDLL